VYSSLGYTTMLVDLRAESVKKHCFFATTNWDDVFAKKVRSKFDLSFQS
jgi:hypothetical protein